MFYDGKIWIGKSGEENIYIYPGKANRHGLIAGATGTGKTVTLKVMAESFSDAGVPVFLADVKGDLSGMSKEGVLTEDMQSRRMVSRCVRRSRRWDRSFFPGSWDLTIPRRIS